MMFFIRQLPGRALFFLFFAFFSCLFATRAQGAGKYDFSAWETLPVMHQGRVMPLDALARSITEGKLMRFSLEGAGLEDLSEAELRVLEEKSGMTAGVSRKFTPSELLFSWLAEPEIWEYIPFLNAENQDLRELMELPIYGKNGGRLRGVSPRQLERFCDSPRFQDFWREMGRLREENPKQEYPPEKKKLMDAIQQVDAEYTRFREVTFQPAVAGIHGAWFMGKFQPLDELWKMQGFTNLLGHTAVTAKDMPTFQALSQAVKALQDFYGKSRVAEMRGEPISLPLSELAAECKKLADAAEGMRKLVDVRVSEILKDREKSGISEKDLRNEQFLRFLTETFAVQARELLYALYENTISLNVLPSLDPAPLDAQRTERMMLHPWLSLSAVLYGDADGVLKGFPPEGISAAREAFAGAINAWKAGEPEKFSVSMRNFSAALRETAVKIEPQRRELLPEERRDAEILAATAYPPREKMRTEVFYYNLQPFKMAWILPFVGMLFFGFAGILGFVGGEKSETPAGGEDFFRTLHRIQAFCFWTGFLLLAAGLFFSVYGLYLRAWIMSRAPVTNSFETIVFVSLTAGVMGMWFTLRPVLDPFFARGWAATVFPWDASARPASALPWGMLMPRVLTIFLVFQLFLFNEYGLGAGYSAIQLFPRVAVGATMPILSDVVIWISGMLTLLVLAWWLPRVLLTPLGGVLGILDEWVSGGYDENIPPDSSRTENRRRKEKLHPRASASPGEKESVHARILRRSWFALAAALSVFLLSGAPFLFQEQFNQNLRNLMPILRDNYWLSIHVMIIVGSYGAGMLAWAFAILSLLVYLFGTYRKAEPGESGARKSPPEICKTLSDLMYRCIQAATLMLVVGTILGGLWADVSWGRFWSWDRKEVWALISLFIYLAILHGRYVRILGEFTLAVGSILGALAIITAWFGVNYFIGSALHAYSHGQVTSLTYFLVVVVVNLVLILCAAIRYYLEVSGGEN